MKKVLFKVSALAATTVMAVSLASCSLGGAKIKSYKNSVEKTEFDAKLKEAQKNYSKDCDAMIEKYSSKSYKAESTSKSSLSYTETKDGKKEEESHTLDITAAYQFDAEKHAYTSKSTTKETSKPSTSNSDETKEINKTAYVDGTTIYRLDNKDKKYTETDLGVASAANAAVDAYGSAAYAAVTLLAKLSSAFTSSVSTYLFETDEIKYYVDNNQFTMAAETTFAKNENATGKAKAEAQVRFDGASIVLVMKATYDYTIKSGDDSETVKSEGTQAYESTLKEKSISYKVEMKENGTETSTSKDSTVVETNNGESSTKTTVKFGSASIKTSIDGYTKTNALDMLF